ncbi:MAG: hypothetical protein L0216_07530 [Planctomycetales bacterium]|nr:hypothetical protein [Planctomycetales bacterium]
MGGRGMTTGALTEAGAETLAIVLRSGALPVPLGRTVNGVPVPGEPESETYVGLTSR